MTSGGPLHRPRLANAYLFELLEEFPAILTTGARATGKSTTAALRSDQVQDHPSTAVVPTRAEIVTNR